MPVEAPQRGALAFCQAMLTCLALSGCSSIGDLGQVQPPAVADNIHAWVGQSAAVHAGGPISLANLTDYERTLRDLAFPLIQPPLDRGRWDQVVYEYGRKGELERNFWVVNPTAYYRELIAANFRSTAGRYNRLNDDIRNDIVRITPFFDMAHRVIEADRIRQATMRSLTDIAPVERLDALARVGENSLTIAWVQVSLAQRAESYRYALDRLAVSEPEYGATEVSVSLTLLQQMIAGNQLVPAPQFSPLPGPVEVAAALPVPPPVAVAVPPPRPVVK
jgi:hypothetical protein